MPITTFGKERMERNLNARRGRRISIVNSDPAARFLTKIWSRVVVYCIFNYFMLNFLKIVHGDDIEDGLSYVKLIQHPKIAPTILLANLSFSFVMYTFSGFASLDDVVDMSRTTGDANADALKETKTGSSRRRKKKSE